MTRFSDEDEGGGPRCRHGTGARWKLKRVYCNINKNSSNAGEHGTKELENTTENLREK